VQDPAITFHHGDADQLSLTFSPAFMGALARPLMVIEDSSHMKETTLATLNFFHNWLVPNEYIVIEDGIINELGLAEVYHGGPRAAIEVFLAQHAEYEVESRYCDWFGRNVTYAVNGFLRRCA
jgi:cephalosporin hydroxylase